MESNSKNYEDIAILNKFIGKNYDNVEGIIHHLFPLCNFSIGGALEKSNEIVIHLSEDRIIEKIFYS